MFYCEVEKDRNNYKVSKNNINTCPKCFYSIKRENQLICRLFTRDKSLRTGRVRVSREGSCVRFEKDGE
jgi:hypothetical protein